jgi:hypothetical protein
VIAQSFQNDFAAI